MRHPPDRDAGHAMREASALDFRCIRWHRTNAGLSGEVLATRAGISRATVSHLETGRHRSMLAVRAVASVLGVEPEELGRCGHMPEPPLRLADKREGRGLTPGQLAHATGLTERIVHRAEEGVMPHPPHAKALADFFGCRVTDFDFYPREAAA